jgi:hypothetical protein
MSSRSNVQIIAVGAGAALVAGFFLPFFSQGGFSISAWGMVRHGMLAWTTAAALIAIPIAGVLLAIAGMSSEKAARTGAVATGVGILGYMFVKMAWEIIAGTGIGLWMIVGASVVALVAGLAATKKLPAKTE